MSDTAEEFVIPSILPHQEVLKNNGLEFRTFFDATVDPKGTHKMNLGRIESRFATAIEMDEENPKREKELRASVASSEKFAGAILEMIAKKAEDEKAGEKAQDEYTAAMNEGATLVGEQKFTEALEAYNKALALNINNEAAQAEINKVNEALALAAQNDAAQQYVNFIESGDGRANEASFEDALALYEQALALNVNNDEAQQRIAAVKEAQRTETISKGAEIVKAVIKDVTEIIKTKGAITHIELTDAGINTYDKEAAQFIIGNDELGVKLALQKVSDGVYKLAEEEKKPEKKGPNWVAIIFGTALGAGALYLLYDKVIKPRLQKKA